MQDARKEKFDIRSFVVCDSWLFVWEICNCDVEVLQCLIGPELLQFHRYFILASNCTLMEEKQKDANFKYFH